MVESLTVADAKRRFSELLDRVRGGERFVVLRRGKPAVALIAPDQVGPETAGRPLGLAAVAGALEEWADLPDVIEEIYRARRRSKDRPVDL